MAEKVRFKRQESVIHNRKYIKFVKNKMGCFLCALFSLTLLWLSLSSCSNGIGARSPVNPSQKTQENYPSFVKITAPSLQSPIMAVETPTKSVSPSLTTNQNIDTIEVNWEEFGSASQYNAIEQPEWLSNTVAKLAVYSDGFSDAYVTVDLSDGKNAKATAASIHSDWRIFSPRKTFTIECKDGLKMYRVQDSALISDASSLISLPSWLTCSTVVRWSPDETHASLVDANNDAYVWPSNGSEPYKVSGNIILANTSWSPNSSELAVVTSLNEKQIGRANILDLNGKVLRMIDFQSGGDGPLLDWFTDQILVSYSRYDRWYYEKSSGQFLFHWVSMPTGDGIWHQQPQISPDGRWIFIDQGGWCETCTPVEDQYPIIKEYSLYDVLKKEQIELLHYEGNYLGFAGWNRDSSKIYLISRPQGPDSTSAPSTPFGLLAYDLQTHQFDLVFKDAVQVAWNTDQSYAFILFAERDDQGNLGLAGGIWSPETGQLVEQPHFWGQMLYQDPALDAYSNIFPGPVPVAWSHDGQMVAVSDEKGQVILLGVKRTEQILLRTQDGTKGSIALRWSLDDQHLLIENGYNAWIVTVPLP